MARRGARKEGGEILLSFDVPEIHGRVIIGSSDLIGM